MAHRSSVTALAAAVIFCLSAVSSASVDLKLTKTAPASIAAGERITFQVVVHNDSSFQAEAIRITDELPEQTRANVAVEGGGLECFQEGATVSCLGDFLPAGETRTVRISADVLAGSTGQILNTASVQTASPELNPLDNEASAVTAVEPATAEPANLSLVATGTPEVVRPRSLVTYNIQATNHGSATGLNTILIGELPAGIEFLSAESPQGPCVLEGNLVTCNLGDIAAGGAAHALVNVRTMNTIGSLTGRFFCMPQNPDSDEGDNDAEVPTRVERQAPPTYSCCETNIRLDLEHGSINNGRLGIIAESGFERNPRSPHDLPTTRTLTLKMAVPISWECLQVGGAGCLGTFDVELLEEPKQAGADGAFTVPPAGSGLSKTYKRRKCIAGRKHYASLTVIYNASYPTQEWIQGTFRIRIKVPEGKGGLNHIISTELTSADPGYGPIKIEDTGGRIE